MQDDLGVEDIEDVDALVDQAAAGGGNGGLSSGLAAKLAAFEAIQDED